MPAPHPPEFRQRAVELACGAREADQAHCAGPGDQRELSSQLDGPGRRRRRQARGLTITEREELRKCAPSAGGEDGARAPEKSRGLLRHGERPAPPAVRSRSSTWRRPTTRSRCCAGRLGVSEPGVPRLACSAGLGAGTCRRGARSRSTVEIHRDRAGATMAARECGRSWRLGAGTGLLATGGAARAPPWPRGRLSPPQAGAARGAIPEQSRPRMW